VAFGRTTYSSSSTLTSKDIGAALEVFVSARKGNVEEIVLDCLVVGFSRWSSLL
jgi:hypothetical protein